MIAFPIVAFLVSLACAVLVGVDAARRPKPDRVSWAIAFGLFAIAAGAEVVGSLDGWTPMLVRLYYLTGATLVVGYLALGQLYLLFGSRIAKVAPGAALLVTALAATFVLDAPIDEARLASAGWHALERGPALIATTVSINALGTAVVVGGALWSAATFWGKRVVSNRMIGCVLIALGTLVVAAGGSLTRLGNPEYLYVAMAVGVATIFAGYLQARRRDRPPATTAESLAQVSVEAGLVPSEPAALRRVSPVVSLPGSRARRLEAPRNDDPGATLIAGWLGAHDAPTISTLCAEWSVAVEEPAVLSRADARRAWALRLRLSADDQAAFDRLPVPVRRQLATLVDEVFDAVSGEEGRRATG